MRIESSNPLQRLERLQQARLSPSEPPLNLAGQVRFYDRAIGHLDRLRQGPELTPEQWGRIFPSGEFEERLRRVTAPHFQDNSDAESTRAAVAASFREARRERARAEHSPHQEVEGLVHSVQLPDRTIRFRPDEPRWVEVERGEQRLRWSEDQVERSGPKGTVRLTLAGEEAVQQTPEQRSRALPDGGSVVNGQHRAPGFAPLDSPPPALPWWREPQGQWERGDASPLPGEPRPPLTADQDFAPLAELQSELSEAPATVGRLALEKRFHQRSDALMRTQAAGGPGEGDFMKLFKGERPPDSQGFNSIDEVLKALKLAPNGPGLKLKEAAKKASAFLPDFYLLPSLFEVVKRIGVDKALTILDKMTRFGANAKAEARDPQMTTEFLRALIDDVARPSQVRQQGAPTCAPASIQVRLAGEDPVKYVDMMTTLASGKSYKSGGMTFKPPGGAWNVVQPDGRNLTAWMFQESLNGARADGQGRGMTRDDNARISQALLGEEWNPLKVHNEEAGIDTLMEQLEDDLARGRSVSISVVCRNEQGQPANHAVLVVGIDKTSNPTRFEIVSWGERGWLTDQELRSCLVGVRAADDWFFDDNKVKKGTKKETIPAG
ncbi:hypothetical protein ABS71_02400 [bacterium SCN 62-11]|nr:hypothetical protein [Candidatus Eremiobacteraeota bacterium]ODT77743.1 MAG: hypothetical protein ABS71_02400 [bacterium SCN 62-11]